MAVRTFPLPSHGLHVELTHVMYVDLNVQYSERVQLGASYTIIRNLILIKY